MGEHTTFFSSFETSLNANPDTGPVLSKVASGRRKSPPIFTSRPATLFAVSS